MLSCVHLYAGGFGIVTRGAVRDVTFSGLHIHDVGAGGVSVEKPTDYVDGSAVQNLSLVDSVIHVRAFVSAMIDQLDCRHARSNYLFEVLH